MSSDVNIANIHLVSSHHQREPRAVPRLLDDERGRKRSPDSSESGAGSAPDREPMVSTHSKLSPFRNSARNSGVSLQL